MDYSTENVRAKGSSNPEILVITEIPSQRTLSSGRVLGQREMEVFADAALKAGLENNGTVFINPCPPIPEEFLGSEKKVGEWLSSYADEFREIVTRCEEAKLIICLGKDAVRQTMGRPQKITRIAGQLLDHPSYFAGKVLPVYSPRMVLRKPEIAEVFESQMRMAGVYQQSGWEDTVFQGEVREAGYRWATDLQFLIDAPPKRLVVDTETLGVKWFDPTFKVLTVQLCWGTNNAVSVPLDRAYYPSLDLRTRSRIIGQLKQILSNPATQIIGHNFKFDIHAFLNLGIEVPSWWADTIQLAFLVDENMEMKGLDDCVRRWVPAMSGYADEFNRDPIHQGKSRMDLVPHDKMLAYGCGDVDATFRLADVLIKEGKKDTRNWKTFHTIQMPALKAFAKMERQGLRVDLDQLGNLGKLVERKERELYTKLVQSVHPALKLDHLNDPSNKGKSAREILNFGSPKFLLDVLFNHPRGLCLEPVVFTKTTQRLAPEERVPSTSANDHLPFFTDREFVRDLIEYKKLEKMRTSYVGTGRQLSDAPVVPLKKGNWPKKIFDAFQAEGITLANVDSPTRRRRIVIPGREPKEPDNLIMLGQESSGVTNYAYLSNGRPYLRRVSRPTGFWQHLPPGRNDVHPSFWAHRTVTGRTASCLHADVLIDTFDGKKRIADVVPGDLVWTHNKRWKRVLNTFFKPTQMMIDSYLSNGEILRSTFQHRIFTISGNWSMVGHVNLQKTRFMSAHPPQGGGSLSQHLKDDGASCHCLWGNTSYCDCNFGRVYRLGRVGEAQGCEVFRVEARREEPNAWKDTCESQRGLQRWPRIPDKGDSGKEAFCPSYCSGRDAWNPSREFAVEPFDPSYRWGQGEQPTGQLGPNHQSRARCNSSEVSAYSRGVTIERSVLVGSYPVYDIEVEEDHSYSACGIFHHNSDPNAQNFPKRGELAEAFRKLFIPAKGWVFLECDLSQIELRIAAWMAMEPTMLAIYRSGGDIHAATAASTLGITIGQFSSYSGNKNAYQSSFFGHMPSDIKTMDDFYEFKRFQAKAINFGFIYGMWWVKFKVYAKTDYGIEFTDEEAKEVRETFFETFPKLKDWHDDSKDFAMRHGFVRALHGALRRLPSVFSDDEGVQKEAQRQAVNCLSDDTEILTEGGWKTVDDLSEGDTVFSVNPSTGGVERDAVLAIHCGNINGRMLNYEGSVSALATPNHRWLVDRYSQAKVTKGNLESVFVESKGLSDYGDHRIWLAGGALQQDETQWTNDECALMGWVLTDGYYKRQNCPKTGKAWGTGRIGVTQTKKKNIGELDALFTRLGKHSRRVRKTGQHVWEITTCATKRMRDAMPGKTLTTDVILSMNSEQRKLLYETMLRGDGCYDTKAGRYRKFCAGSKERADAFLALCALIGQPASAVCRDFSSYSPKQYASMGNVPKSGNCWLVELKQRNRAQSGYGKSWVEWEGRVWCPTTRNGTWIAKRNGKVFVTGNSPVQRFGSDLGLMGVTRFSRDCDHRVMHPCGFIHDAGIIHVREDHVEEAASAVKFYMESNPLREWFGITPPLPLLADVAGPGDSLGGMKKMKHVRAIKPDWYNADLDRKPLY